MKNIKILTVVLLAIGIAGMGIGCGSSSGGSSGSQVSSGVNSLPPANLTVQNIGSAASQAISSANQKPPTDVSTITSTTVNGAPNQSLPVLSYLFKNLGNNVVIKPQSMRGTALNALSMLKQAATSGYCAPVVTDSSTPNNLDVTATWNNASCTSSTETITINGTVTVKGTYDSTLGNLAITESLNLTFKMTDSASGLDENFTMNGSDTITGSGIVLPITSISYNEKGTMNLSATVTSGGHTGSFSGWVTMDDTFTGTPSQLMFTINDGEEIDTGGSKLVGTYAIATITMTTYGGSPITAITVNGNGTYGVAVSGTTYAYSGRINVVYSNLVFDYTSCFGPADGTITITGAAGNVFEFNFHGQQCDCAAVTENGTPVTGSPFCGL
jgi:hypothetical protein